MWQIGMRLHALEALLASKHSLRVLIKRPEAFEDSRQYTGMNLTASSVHKSRCQRLESRTRTSRAEKRSEQRALMHISAVDGSSLGSIRPRRKTTGAINLMGVHTHVAGTLSMARPRCGQSSVETQNKHKRPVNGVKFYGKFFAIIHPMHRLQLQILQVNEGPRALRVRFVLVYQHEAILVLIHVCPVLC